MWLNDNMEEIDKGEFGGFTDDVEGDVTTRKIQTGGRVNFPDRFLEYIGCEKQDKVLISAESDRLIIRKASVDSLAVTGMMEGTLASMGEIEDDE